MERTNDAAFYERGMTMTFEEKLIKEGVETNLPLLDWARSKGMELTTEKKKEYIADLFCKVADSGFLEWLGKGGFYTAPASKSHHGAEAGALFAHSRQVTLELAKLTDNLDLKWQRKESPIIVGMLHDVCKMDDYIIKDTEEGQIIEWNPERTYPGHGEKSLIMLAGHIDLTEEERMCIRYHMGAFTDSKEWEFYSRAVKKYPNVLYTHTADMIASQIKGV